MVKVCREQIPWAMAAGRALLGPVVIVGERCGWSGMALAAGVVTALVSDIFDGVLARQWRCDSDGIRLFDSMADTAFYLCVAVTLWFRLPQLWHADEFLIGGVLGLEALRLVFDCAKYGKPASYHSYLAKTWGLAMASAVVVVLATARATMLFPAALLVGVACNVEGMAMSLILPAWRKDIKTLASAWRLRRATAPIARQSQTVRRRTAAALSACAVAAVLISAAPAAALEANEAVYVGGSQPLAAETAGTVDTTSPAALAFRYRNPDGSAGQFTVPYATVRNVSGSSEVTHRLGVAPAIAVGLLAARQRRYLVTVTWTDETGVPQAAQIEVSRRSQQPLLAVIRARMPQPCQRPASPCARPAPGKAAIPE